MPTLAEAAPIAREQAGETPKLSSLQPPGEFGANDGLEAKPPTHEQTGDVTDSTASTSDQKVDSNVLPEMPSSHPEVDAATISVDGLIKNCPHYAEMHKRDPERAEAEATQTAQKAQEVTVMREQGMSAQDIRAKMMAENLARAKEKAKAMERQPKPESRTDPVQDKSAEHQATTTEQTAQTAASETDKVRIEAVSNESREADEAQAVSASVEPPLEEQARAAVQVNEVHLADTAEMNLLSHDDGTQTVSGAALLADAAHRADDSLAARQQHDRHERFIIDQDDNADPSLDVFKPVAFEIDVEEFEDVIGDRTTFSAVSTEEDLPEPVQALIIVDQELVGLPDPTDEIDAALDGLDGAFEPSDLLEPIDEASMDEGAIDNETMDTYELLIGMIEQPAAAVDIVDEPSDDFAEGYVALIQQEDDVVSEVGPNQFEGFVARRPASEEAVVLETIKESAANNQPLQETLAQLAVYLAEAGIKGKEFETEDPAQDVVAVLSRLKAAIEEAEAQELLSITPEVTQELLALLRTIGYQNPQAVLVEFVEEHGIDYLTQAISYLYQLSDEDKPHELLQRISTTITQATDEPLSTTLLRKIILKLIRTKLEISELTVVS